MNKPNTHSENGNSIPAVDVLNENPHSNSTFHDPSNPLLAPPKQLVETKQKSRKRKLIILCFVSVLLAGSAFALHRLLKVNRVNVSVQADTRHDGQSAKTKEDPKGSDNNSSVEAIRLARQALGSDSPTNNGSASPTPTPSPQENSTESTTVGLRSLSGTIYQPKPSDNGSTNARTGSTSNATPDQQTSGTNTAAQELAQSRANTTQTIYVGDSPAKAPATAQINQPSLRPDTKARSKTTENPAVLPPFGTMLPVRTQGVVFTLRNNSYARLELVRDMKGSGWSLPKSTVLIGRASGSEYDRAFITVIGYIDSRDNRLVKMSGEVLGSDGGSGIQGKRVVVDSGGLKRALSKIASSGMQAAGLLASGFGGQRTVIVDGAGNRIISPITDEASRMFGGASGDKRAFVKVEAGRPAYVMVADLPKDRPAIDAPGEDELQHGASLTDRELMELLILGTREEISAAIPLMTDEQKILALKTLATGNEKK
jgi:hypothetical protein